MSEPYSFKIGSLELRLELLEGCELDFDCFSSNFLFKSLPGEVGYKVRANCISYPSIPFGKILLEGKPWESSQMDYFWRIYDSDGRVGIYVRFQNPDTIEEAVVFVDESNACIDYFFKPTKLRRFKFDVFVNPLGLLLFIYLSNYHGGMVMHASGVEYGGAGYVFSGLSGVGKTTMARLWQSSGASIINDDRLLLMPKDGRFAMYNTPMPYYNDSPRSADVDAVFLIYHSQTNSIRQITGATALAKVMANCMQHFHSASMVKKHVGNISDLLDKVRLFELGFKPDADVVKFIREVW